jgi:hypothetical protein
MKLLLPSHRIDINLMKCLVVTLSRCRDILLEPIIATYYVELKDIRLSHFLRNEPSYLNKPFLKKTTL